MDSRYEDLKAMARQLEAGQHRAAVGGRWDEIGRLQFDALCAAGLEPGHRLLDVGCGALRGGVHFIPYLAPGHYHGFDINPDLIATGRREELSDALRARAPEANFCTGEAFDFAFGDTRFDYALAVSLFTHLSQNKVELCLARLRGWMVPGGSFYATFFEAPEEADPAAPLTQGDGIRTWGYQNPFHYTLSQIRAMAGRTGWQVEWIGDFGHPRGQKLARFIAPDTTAIRALPPDAAAAQLKGGGDHYRAYVGPPAQWDFMGATQFRLLTTLGLRETHAVLDFGCGSLRAGRLLMAYLAPGRYHGIEPNRWLIEEAIARELGADFIRLNAPRLDHNDRFDMEVFGTRFDFIVAQSVFSHAGPDLVARALASAKRALAADGLMLATFIHRTDIPAARLEQPGWRYPGNISYRPASIRRLISEAGLTGRALPWYHPRQTWYALAHDETRLPDPAWARLLRGPVLRDPEFSASWQGKTPEGKD